MSVEFGMTIMYIAIGVMLAMYWWETEHAQKAKELKKEGIEVERGMVNIYLITVATFWPIKCIYNFIKFMCRSI